MAKQEEVKVTRAGSQTFYVKCPFDRGFIDEAKRLGGYWEKSTKTWSFVGVSLSAVEDLLKRFYGEDCLKEKTVAEEVCDLVAEKTALIARISAINKRLKSLSVGEEKKSTPKQETPVHPAEEEEEDWNF